MLGRIIDGRDKGLDLKKVPQPNGDLHYIAPNGKVWTEAELAETAEVEFTPLGFDIQRKIQEIPLEENKRGNDVQILGACVMPEHIHFVLYVRQPMAQNVGMVIRGFKQGCNKLLKKYLDIAESSASATIADLSNPSAIAPFEESAPTQSCVGCSLQESPLGSAVFLKSASSAASASAATSSAASAAFLKNASARILEEHSLFEDDFDETRLRRKGQLRAMIDYVHKNPVHRWLRANKPHWGGGDCALARVPSRAGGSVPTPRVRSKGPSGSSKAQKRVSRRFQVSGGFRALARVSDGFLRG